MQTDNQDGCQEGEAPASCPFVSLGLPVYNGSNFLRPALDSILAQTYRNWELILSDNGSSDSTPSICADYAAADSRIRFYRHPVNMGASRNFNFVFGMARGPLFRWTAHDDTCEPTLIERCVEGLEAHPTAVLCHPRTRVIGPSGEILYNDPVRLRTGSPQVERRYKDLICVDHACFQIFGLIRTEILRQTPLLGAFVGSDRNLLAELALHGPFLEIQEELFFRRDHPNTSTRQFPLASARLAWFKDSTRGARFPTLHRAYGYLASLARAPLTMGERMACLAGLAEWSSQRLLSFFRTTKDSAEALMRAWRIGKQAVGLPAANPRLANPPALTTDSPSRL